MRVGAILSQADAGTDPTKIRQYARELEEAGYEHLMAYDHVLGASPERLGAGPFGGFPEPPYTSEHTFHEIFVLFSHLAAVTSTMEFVTSVVVLPQRQAPVVAKQAATMDLLSEGRLRLAVGAGWNAAEYMALGADFDRRTAVLEEQIEVMRKLWTERIVTFDGRFHQLDRVGINPLPERPIPVMMGTRIADAAMRRVARVADGWMPLALPGIDRGTLAEGVRRMREICESQGRDPDSLPVFARVYFGPGWQAETETALRCGCADFSVGVNRFENPDMTLEDHLRILVETKPEIDSLVG